MEVKKLDFGETLKDSVAIGVKNAPSVIAAVALWLITIWIPYLNVQCGYHNRHHLTAHTVGQG